MQSNDYIIGMIAPDCKQILKWTKQGPNTYRSMY